MSGGPRQPPEGVPGSLLLGLATVLPGKIF